MKILVIGGTRFIGRKVVQQLTALNHQVTIFHRGKTKTDLPNSVQEILGDRKDIVRQSDQLRSFAPDVVLDMIPITENDAESLISTFTGLNLRIVTISSQDVYRAYGVLIGIEPGPVEPIPYNEQSPLRQVLFPYRGEILRDKEDERKYLDDYEKILIEQKIIQNNHHPGTVLRLPMVYGPRDSQHRFFEHIKRMQDDRPAIFLHSGYAQWRSTWGYVDNVASAITTSILDDRASGRIFNVGDVNNLSTLQWIEKIGSVIGWDGQVIILENDHLPDHLQPGFNTDQLMVADCSLIHSVLDLEETVPIDEAIRRTYAWDSENPPINLDLTKFNYKEEDRLYKSYLDK
jgi:nucleoside-diphosphate-sugar epimerase